MTHQGIASLWIGPQLSWLECLSINSFLRQGHPYTLYCYDPPQGVPDGVNLRPASQVCPAPQKPSARRNSVIHSDLFRAKLLSKTNMIWADLDVICRRPIATVAGHVHGYIKPDRIGSSLLRLPPESATLRKLLKFVTSPAPIPVWARDAESWRQRAAQGEHWNIHALTWGDAGPRALTYFLQATGEDRHSSPQEQFYPIGQGKLHWLFDPNVPTQLIETEATNAVHVFGYTRKLLAKHHNGLPPEGGWLHNMCKLHQIDPKHAPIPQE